MRCEYHRILETNIIPKREKKVNLRQTYVTTPAVNQ